MMPKERPKQTRSQARNILSVPVSPEQRAELERRAGRRPISAYARDTLFPANDNDPAGKPRTHAKTSRKDVAALASVLGTLGPVANVLKQLTHGIASGVLPFAPDTEAAIMKACQDIADIKAMILKALGIRQR